MHTAILVFTTFLLAAVTLGVILVTLPRWLAPREPSELKERAYECGEIPVGEPWIRFRVSYYIFALAFVVFDVEAVFLYPWAVDFGTLAMFGLVAMLAFLALITVPFVYEWRRGGFEWD